MKRSLWGLVVILAIVFTTAVHAATRPNPPEERVNIVMVMVDDLGLYDLSCYGYEAVDTPHADRLASEGMLFRNAYAGAPVCSPSRAAVISGQAPARVHVTNHISHQHFEPENPRLLNAPMLKALPPETVTVAEVLRDAGYACGFFGKWHLSLQHPDWSGRVVDPNTLPDCQGFENNVGGNGNGGPAGGWFSPYKNVYLKDGPEGEYLPCRLADEAVAYMDANKEGPFFIAMWNYTVHSPIETTEELKNKYRARKKAGARIGNPVYAGMIEAADSVLGRLLDKVDELGLRDNTLVILTSDNGGFNYAVHDHAPLRKTKGWLYDGGLRIPMIVRWPGKVKPGTVNESRVTHVDFFPTFLEAANVPIDPALPLDGESLVPLLTGKGGLKRDAIYFHYPNYAWHTQNRLGGVIIERDFKLLNWYENDSVELYNLKVDPSEMQDISAQKPELADRLKRKLKRWLKATNANMPIPNEDYVVPKGAM